MTTARTYSASLSSALHKEANAHLLRPDGQEDLCFALWNPSQGSTRSTALLSELILPQPSERRVHGNASFLPNYFERAVAKAASANSGLAFLHSHPGPGWQDMSGDDIRAEQGHAAAAQGATGLPLVGLTLGTDGAWAVPTLVALLNHPTTQVRVLAATDLGRIGSAAASAKGALQGALKDPNAAVKHAAQAALERIETGTGPTTK